MKEKRHSKHNWRIVLFSLVLLQHPTALHGLRHNSTAARQHTGRSLLHGKPPATPNIPSLNKSLYDTYDQYVTAWKDLGVTHYMDVGTWGGLTFQVNMWLRFPCSADSTKREARLVVVMSQAPARKYWWNWLEVVPKQLLVDGKLPTISFKSMHDRESPAVNVTLAVWEDLIKQEVRTAALVGHATLHPGTLYSMEVEGVERVFQLPPKPCSPAATTVFGGNSAWIGVGGRATKTNPPAMYAFLVMEHVRHHMKLGFAGLAIVVQPHIAVGLLANDGFVSMVKQRHILLLTWEWSYNPSRDNNIQVTAQNLISMAMHGAHNYLGLWDLDEYLVLPSHRPVMHEVKQGCLRALLEKEEEAVLPFELASAANWSNPLGEISAWLDRGSFREAAKHLHYTTQSYAHCKYGLCKSLIDTNTDLIVRVHELQKLPPKDVRREPVPRSCGYILHFFQLWGVRPFKKAAKGEELLARPVPLNAGHLPQV